MSPMSSPDGYVSGQIKSFLHAASTICFGLPNKSYSTVEGMKTFVWMSAMLVIMQQGWKNKPQLRAALSPFWVLTPKQTHHNKPWNTLYLSQCPWGNQSDTGGARRLDVALSGSGYGCVEAGYSLLYEWLVSLSLLLFVWNSQMAGGRVLVEEWRCHTGSEADTSTAVLCWHLATSCDYRWDKFFNVEFMAARWKDKSTLCVKIDQGRRGWVWKRKGRLQY